MAERPVDLIRTGRLGQRTSKDAPMVTASQYLYPESTFTALDGSAQVTGHARAVAYSTFASVADCDRLWTTVAELSVRVRPLVMTELGWYLPRLRELLEASTTTDNPVVLYHCGNSIGYD